MLRDKILTGDWFATRDFDVSETITQDGELSTHMVDKQVAELRILVPVISTNATAFNNAQVYQPRWNGANYILEWLGEFSVGS